MVWYFPKFFLGFSKKRKKVQDVIVITRQYLQCHAILIFRYIDDQFYLIVGSKNVHMLIRGTHDIDLYEGSRYEYAKVSKSLNTLVSEM